MDKLIEWYQSEAGQKIAQAEVEAVQKILPNLFGYHLLQLGNHKELEWLKSSRISHRFRLSPQPLFSDDSWVQSTYEALPLANSSIDVMVMPHILPQCVDVVSVLEEASRVLLSEGSLLLFGFNRWHPWCWRYLPKKHHALSFSHLERVLNDAGLAIMEHRWLHYGAVYFLHIQKQVYCITPMKARWQEKLIAKDFLQPTARKM